MGILFACLILGIIIGWVRLLPARVLQQAGRGMLLGVLILLFSMGLRVGADQTILSQFVNFGLQALVFAVATTIGSLLIVRIFEKVLLAKFPVHEDNALEVNPGGEPSHVLTWAILGTLALGIIGGKMLFPQEWTVYLPDLTSLALNFTMIMVGIDLGMNRDIWNQMRKVGWQVFLAPIGVIIGSIGAAMLVGLCFGWDFRESGAVGAGFGWYSLSGVLISDLHSLSLGTIAFLSNIFRELLALILAPFLAKKVGPLALVAPSGATAMDSTLPVLVAVGPKGVGIIAIISGLNLSLLVPVLVPLFLG